MSDTSTLVNLDKSYKKSRRIRTENRIQFEEARMNK